MEKALFFYKQHAFLIFPTLYISGEESEEQISARAKRIGLKGDNVEVISENQMESISEIARQKRPKLLIIDSIQTVSLISFKLSPRICLSSQRVLQSIDEFS